MSRRRKERRLRLAAESRRRLFPSERSSGERIRREADAEAFDEVGDAGGIQLERIAFAEIAESVRVCLHDATELDELRKEALEAGGRDDLEDPARLLSSVPEGVPLAARLEDEVTGASLHDVVAEECSHAAFEHVAVFVFPQMPMERRS